MRRSGALALLLAALAAAPAWAAKQVLTPITPTISGNTLSAHIVLGSVVADLAVTYESVTGLSASNVSLHAGLLPVTDPALVSRLPANVTLPASFPMLIRYEPVPGSPLSFDGIAGVEIYTQNLSYGRTPYRLFRAPGPTAPFADVTSGMGMGSIRAGGSSPGFSDYIIAVDRRPVDAVINLKYDALEDALAAHQSLILAPVHAALVGELALSRSLYGALDLDGAVNALVSFLAIVVAESGAAIPDVFHADGTGLPNAAGELGSLGKTLQYSLSVKAGSGLL